MPLVRRMLLLSALLVLAALPCTAAPPATPATVELRTGAVVPAPAPTPAALEAARLAHLDRVAVQTELEQQMARTRLDVAALQAQCDAATDAALKNALQQRIEAAKREGRLEFFRIQLRHAQAAGRIEQVQELQSVLDHVAKMPVAPLAPLPAAAPRVAPAIAPARTVSKPVKGGAR